MATNSLGFQPHCILVITVSYHKKKETCPLLPCPFITLCFIGLKEMWNFQLCTVLFRIPADVIISISFFGYSEVSASQQEEEYSVSLNENILACLVMVNFDLCISQKLR